MPPPLGRLEFGGPDLPPRRLRDLLQAQVDASPPGSRIDWATYYFRDRVLAAALMRASDRGVQVRLVLEPDPRRRGTNDAVIAMLQAHGLGGGFHLYRGEPRRRGHLHAKIYAFSEPDIAWIGSFNPSGDEPEDAAVIAEIGDQDRGHNLLLAVEQPVLAAALRRHVGNLARRHWLPAKWRLRFNLRRRVDGTALYFYPRLRASVVERTVARLRRGDRLRGAISHLKEGELTRELQSAVDRGVSVELQVHDTERRVPEELVQALVNSGVEVRRISHPDGLPMHAKFLLLERSGERQAWLGSYNFNNKSRRHNAEVLLRTSDASVIAALDQRYAEIASSAVAG